MRDIQRYMQADVDGQNFLKCVAVNFKICKKKPARPCAKRV